MLRSMTAFAAVESAHDFGTLSIELKSVNQRYLDVSLRMPEELRAVEPELRDRVKGRLNRGKLEAGFRFRPGPAGRAQQLELNQPLARALLDAHGELASLAGDHREVDLVELMRWPDVLVESPPDFEPIRAAALALFDQGLARLIEGREREGTALAEAIVARIDEIETWTNQVREWLPDIREQLRDRFEQRLDGLSAPVEPGRMEQEVAMQLQKLDVDEELDRLAAHCNEVRRIVGEEEPAGRQLDFYMQELNREANTLASKSVDARSSKAAVELKVLIEQIREQVQNVE